MTRALITGAAGQDGTYLAELLLAEGYEVFGMVGPQPGDYLPWASQFEGLTPVEGDMTSADSLRTLVRDVQPDEVYNFAAISSVGASWKAGELAAEVNGLGVLRLIEALRDLAPAARLCQASSAEIFGHADAWPQDEATRIAPVSPYGASKAYAHFCVQNARNAHGLFACNAILYNHESPRRPSSFVTGKIAQGAAAIAAGDASELRLGNLDAVRDWGWAPDYVRAMWLMLQADAPDDFVVATGEPHTVRDFAAEAFARVGLDYEEYVVVDPEFFRPVDPHTVVGDATKAHNELGWWPTKTFAEIVDAMVDAAREIL